MSKKPIDIANFFIGESEWGESHLKLQKLVYCANGWHLVLSANKGALIDELPQAWAYGPVYSSLYSFLYGKSRHTSQIEPIENIEENANHTSIVEFSDWEKKLLSWVYKRYEGVSGAGMTQLTHRKGTSWSEITCKEGALKQLIPKDLIQKEFTVLREELRLCINPEVNSCSD